MQLNLDGSVKYTSERNFLDLSYHGLFSQDPGSGNTQNQSGGLTFLRLYPKNWFFLNELNLESNSEMDLDLRTSLTLGAGKAFIRTNFSNFYSALGLQGNRELSQGEGQFNLEGVLRAVYSVFIFENPEVSLNFTGDLIPSLKWEVFNDLFLKWTFYYSFDSRPISETAQKSDWAITLLGLEYKL